MSIYELVFFFKQKTAYEMRISDWSSDVCSSDLDDRRTSSGRVANKPVGFEIDDLDGTRIIYRQNVLLARGDDDVLGRRCRRRRRWRGWRRPTRAGGSRRWLSLSCDPDGSFVVEDRLGPGSPQSPRQIGRAHG